MSKCSDNSLLTLSRTRPISPSKIALISVCPWQFLLSTEAPKSPKIPHSPRAILGSAMHKTIELNAGLKLTGLEVKRLIEEEFGRRVLALPNGLVRWVYIRDGTYGLLPNSIVMAASQLAYKSIQNSQISFTSGTESMLEGGDAHGQLGRERKFGSTVLDMEGWPDLVYRKGNAVHIVDFKLGLSRDEHGSPKQDYILQIASYGVMAKRASGLTQVVLELRSPSDEWVHDLDGHLEASVVNAAQRAQQLLPRGKVFDSTALTRLGPHCQSCSHRPSCRAYSSCLLSGEGSKTGALSPFDITGKVTSVTQVSGLSRIVLAAIPDQRRVIVNGLIDGVVVSGLSEGCKFTAYALASSEIKGKGNYIANFNAWSQSNPRRSAFDAFITVN